MRGTNTCPLGNERREYKVKTLAQAALTRALVVLALGVAFGLFAGRTYAQGAPPNPRTVAGAASPAPTQDLMAWVLASKGHWPAVVALTQPVSFPVLVNGLAAGAIKVPAGTLTKVINLQAGQITVAWSGDTKAVPIEATDLIKRLPAEMARTESAQASIAPWENSLGMKFARVPGTRTLFSIWDTRVADFRAYTKDSGYQQQGGSSILSVVKNENAGYTLEWELDKDAGWQKPGFSQGDADPVVGVNWIEAKAFCDWLTRKERASNLIGPDQFYRLPSDEEWSTAAGTGMYPWGNQWPPPPGSVNAADAAFVAALPGSGWPHLAGNDGYARTSPVGSFSPNQYGLYDMAGNVWQWCEDWYRASMNAPALIKKFPWTEDGGGEKYRVTRGGSWSNFQQECLLSSFRFKGPPADRFDSIGFRCVLAGDFPRWQAPTAVTFTPRVESGPLPGSMSARLDPNRQAVGQRYGERPPAEQAVLRALRWLQAQQNGDGTWGSAGYHNVFTGLALLCFLGHGETPGNSREFGGAVSTAINAMIAEGGEHQGRFSGKDNFTGGDSAFQHGVGTCAICEAYAMTRDERLAPLIQQAVDYIVKAQRADGGWADGYDITPDAPRDTRPLPVYKSDTSLSGWQIQALNAAWLTGLPGMDKALPAVLGNAMKNMDRVFYPKDGSFGYRIAGDAGRYTITVSAPAPVPAGVAGMSYVIAPARLSVPDFTGVGVFAKLLWLGRPDRTVRAGLQNIESRELNYSGRDSSLYAWYYDTQACFQAQGSAWDWWNAHFQDLLTSKQSADGSWPQTGGASYEGFACSNRDSELYRTTLCCLMLEVFYRYLPASSEGALGSSAVQVP